MDSLRAKRGLTTTVIVCLLLLAPPLAEMAPTQTGPPAKPGEILVKFKPGVADEGVRATLVPHGAQTLDEIPHIGVKRVTVPPGREWPTIEALLSDPRVEYAEPNYLAFAIDTHPNDSDYLSGYQWALSTIQAPSAWDIATGSSDIVIAIVDTGVDLDHPDLEEKIVAGRDFVNGDDTPQDDHGHGTHVAGIAGAKTNNGLGIAGVSWGARIMPLKVLDAFGEGTYYDVAQGIYYAADNGAAIINLSLAALAPSSVLEDAVNYAHHSGVLVVAAAGNCALGGDPCNGQVNPDMYPAAYENTVAVAATDISDTPAPFSEHRPYVDVAAPGVDIWSTARDDTYKQKSGTSMAAPHVAGLAALVWSWCPNLTNDQVRYLIEWSADDLGSPDWDEYYGQGRINAYNALSGPPNYVVIRDAPGGGGAEVLDYTMTTDETFTLYAAGYDCEGHYIEDLSVDWATTGTLPYQTDTGTTFAFDPTTPGRGTIMANDGQGHIDETGTMTVEWPFKMFFPLIVHNL